MHDKYFFSIFFIFLKKIESFCKEPHQKTNKLGRVKCRKNKMKNKIQEKINEIKRKLAKTRQFHNRCYVCHVSWHKKGMTFHHITYNQNEKTHSDFPYGYVGTLQYYQYLGPIIKKNPKRFAYLCNPHHHTITKLLQFNSDKQDRIFQLVRKSR